MKTPLDHEAEMLANLICSEPPISRESAARIIGTALAIAEHEGCIRGMQEVNDALTEAFRPKKVA